jgi:hypothetical protein
MQEEVEDLFHFFSQPDGFPVAPIKMRISER